jgi:hypothetical protein
MSRGSCRHQWAAGVAGHQRRRDRSSGRKGEPAVGPARVSIGIAMANKRPVRCGCRLCTETEEAAQSLRQTASRCSAPVNPSGGIFRCRTGNTAAAAHGCRPAWKPPLVERSPEAASLRPRSDPGSRHRQDLQADRFLPDRCSGSGRHPRSQSTAKPIASAFPQSTIDRPIVPPMSSSPHMWTSGNRGSRLIRR